MPSKTTTLKKSTSSSDSDQEFVKKMPIVTNKKALSKKSKTTNTLGKEEWKQMPLSLSSDHLVELFELDARYTKLLKNKPKNKQLLKEICVKRSMIEHKMNFISKYSISNHGNVRNGLSEPLKLNNKNGYLYWQSDTKYNKTNIKIMYRVHRIVALAFVENADPENFNIVNHLDGNKSFNHYKNLEWTSASGNCKHAADTNLAKTIERAVIQYKLDGKTIIARFESIRKAEEETKIAGERICVACRSPTGKHEKYIWRYVDPSIIGTKIEKNELEKKGFKNIKTFPNYWVNKEGEIYSVPAKRLLKLNTKKGRADIQFSRIPKNTTIEAIKNSSGSKSHKGSTNSKDSKKIEKDQTKLQANKSKLQTNKSKLQRKKSRLQRKKSEAQTKEIKVQIKDLEVQIKKIEVQIKEIDKQIKKPKAETKGLLVHNIVAAYFLGKPEKGQNAVGHINGDKLDNRAKNLKWQYVAGVSPDFKEINPNFGK